MSVIYFTYRATDGLVYPRAIRWNADVSREHRESALRQAWSGGGPPHLVQILPEMTRLQKIAFAHDLRRRYMGYQHPGSMVQAVDNVLEMLDSELK
jgi:hypothetical protein